MWSYPTVPALGSTSTRSACADIGVTFRCGKWRSGDRRRGTVWGLSNEARQYRHCGRRRRPHRHVARAPCRQASRRPVPGDLRSRSRALAAEAGADVHSGSNDEVISHPQVTAVIVSTPEQQHTPPILKALELGKPVLVEKPIGFSLREADKILDTLRATKGELRVGYSRRYKECFLRAKEQMLRGRIGKVVGGIARVYNSRAQAFA